VCKLARASLAKLGYKGEKRLQAVIATVSSLAISTHTHAVIFSLGGSWSRGTSSSIKLLLCPTPSCTDTRTAHGSNTRYVQLPSLQGQESAGEVRAVGECSALPPVTISTPRQEGASPPAAPQMTDWTITSPCSAQCPVKPPHYAQPPCP